MGENALETDALKASSPKTAAPGDGGKEGRARRLAAPTGGRGRPHLLPKLTRRSLMVWRRDWLAWRRFMPTSLMANLTEPVLSLLALGLGLGLFVTEIEGISFLRFIGPGLLAAGAMMWVTFDIAFGAYERLHWTRAYHAMISSPLSTEEIVAGEMLWQATRTVLFGTGFLCILLPFGIVQSTWALFMPAVLFIVGAIFTGPALAVAAAARTEEQLSYYFNLIIQPMFFFSGVFFPLSSLGDTVQFLANFLPLSHAVTLSRALVLGNVTPELWWHAAALVAFALVASLLPVPLLRRALERLA